MATELTIYDALAKVQDEMPGLQKNAINPHFKNRYISLDELTDKIVPVLRQNDILLMQAPCETLTGVPGLSTTLYHTPSQTSVFSTMQLVLGKSDPQGQGSAITYARRYSLMAILGLVADEDDDGEKAAASGRAKPASPPENPSNVVSTTL